jgi:protein-tyrosine-phosphatase
MMKALFVCTGNICRSVMAEQLFKKLSRERGLGWDARSCGLAADPAMPVPPGVRRALAESGIKSVDHVSRKVSRELLEWCDLALTMTGDHRKTLSRIFPETAGKVATLRDWAGLPDPDIADPFGEPDETYAACRDRILEALEALMRKHELAQKPRP